LVKQFIKLASLLETIDVRRFYEFIEKLYIIISIMRCPYVTFFHFLRIKKRHAKGEEIPA
jgi:hypothetical protein